MVAQAGDRLRPTRPRAQVPNVFTMYGQVLSLTCGRNPVARGTEEMDTVNENSTEILVLRVKHWQLQMEISDRKEKIRKLEKKLRDIENTVIYLGGQIERDDR